MNNIDLTPSQTVGPFFAYGITAQQYGYGYTQIANNKLINYEKVQGNRIKITGRVIDGAGEPIPDAVIEIWHGDNTGSYSNPSFQGFGRVGTVHLKTIVSSSKPLSLATSETRHPTSM